MSLRRRSAWSLALLGLLALTACSGSDDTGAPLTDGATSTTTTTVAPATEVFPGEDWARAAPGEQGFDASALDALAARAEAAGSTCLVVVRDGVVVADHSWPGPGVAAPREAFSVTKSLTSTLVGIAADRGDLGLDKPAADLITEWEGTASDVVTPRDLLSNTSGRFTDRATDYVEMAIQAEDKTAFSIALDQDRPPGEEWEYNNAGFQTLDDVLERATGTHPSDFAEEVLFAPIGMADSDLRRDAAGNALTFMGLQTTCLDLARFGLLMLHDGRWEDQQVVSAEFVEEATSPSSDLTSAYGLGWWLNEPGRLVSPALATTGAAGSDGGEQGQMLPDGPVDAFWALGFNHQVLSVLPSEGVVAVRLGPKPPESNPFTYRELTQGVLDAL
jgi:CubicO group peptidase (beta-lactamase class C family)